MPTASYRGVEDNIWYYDFVDDDGTICPLWGDEGALHWGSDLTQDYRDSKLMIFSSGKQFFASN